MSRFTIVIHEWHDTAWGSVKVPPGSTILASQWDPKGDGQRIEVEVPDGQGITVMSGRVTITERKD